MSIGNSAGGGYGNTGRGGSDGFGGGYSSPSSTNSDGDNSSGDDGSGGYDTSNGGLGSAFGGLGGLAGYSGFGGYTGPSDSGVGGWSLGGLSLNDDGSINGPPGFDSPGYSLSRASEGLTGLAKSYAESLNPENFYSRMQQAQSPGMNLGLGYQDDAAMDYGLGLRNNYAQPTTFDSVMGAAAEAQHNNQDVGWSTRLRDVVFNNDPRFSAMGMMQATNEDMFSGIKSGYGRQNSETGATENDNAGQALGVASALMGLRSIGMGPIGIVKAIKGVGDLASIASFRGRVDGYSPTRNPESPSRTTPSGDDGGADYDQGTEYASVGRNTESPSAPVSSGVSLAMQRKHGQNTGYTVSYPKSFGYDPYRG